MMNSTTSLKFLKHIREKILKWKNIGQLLDASLSHDLTENDDVYNVTFVKTIPYNDPYYDSNNTPHWTFAFVKTMYSCDDIFVLFSDSPEGFYKKNANNDPFMRINYCTPCIFGSNKLRIGQSIDLNNYLGVDDVDYEELDWNTGLERTKSKKKRKKSKNSSKTVQQLSVILEDSEENGDHCVNAAGSTNNQLLDGEIIYYSGNNLVYEY